MSKKHFIAMAEAFSQIEDIATRRTVAEAFADVAVSCNPRFNRHLFLRECGL